MNLKGVYNAESVGGTYDVDYIVVNRDDPDLVPVAIPLPKRPPKTKIDGYKDSKKNQKFRRAEIPDHLKMVEEDAIDNFEYFEMMNADDYAFAKREVERIKNGYWFFNYGKPTYITGTHYFFLTYWRNSQNGSYLDYRKTNREFFIYWDWIDKHPYHEGLLFFTKRRGGKTEMASSMLYDRSAFNDYTKCGIQSKTDDDAVKVFQDIVVQWRDYMPMFLKPIHGGSNDNPGKELKWDKPRETSKRNSKYRKVKVRHSKIDYRSSRETAYDGRELNYYYGDEFAKTEGCNVWSRHKIVRKCCRNSTGDLVGKMLYSTTVEMLDKEAGQAAVLMFQQSSIKEMMSKELITTASGLLPYFCPAKECTLFDDYGNPRVEASMQKIMNERKPYKGKDLYDEIRKNPNSIREAFIGDAFECHFDIENLNSQGMLLLDIDYANRYVKGRLEREDKSSDGPVKFVPDDNGDWLFHNLPDDPNKFTITNSFHKKANGDMVSVKRFTEPTQKYAIGTDPFDHHRDVLSVNSNRKSNGAAMAYRVYDESIDEEEYMVKGHPNWDERYEQRWQNTAKFTALYVARPDDPNEYYEEMIKACCFLGSQILVETQKSGIINYFTERGYKRFLAYRPYAMLGKDKSRREIGMPSNKDTMNICFDYMIDEVKNKSYKMWFPQLIDDLKFIDIKSRTKYDVGMAALITLARAYDIVHKPSFTRSVIDRKIKTFSFQ